MAAVRAEGDNLPGAFAYWPGKADWFAAGLPREGREAQTRRVEDIARRDVPTCLIDELVGAVHDGVRDGGWDVCVVVNERRVVLGSFVPKPSASKRWMALMSDSWSRITVGRGRAVVRAVAYRKSFTTRAKARSSFMPRTLVEGRSSTRNRVALCKAGHATIGFATERGPTAGVS
jgi:hypothetical protein